MSAPYARRSYVAAAATMKAGDETPRTFLERCLAAIDAHEADVRAFTHIEVEAARRAADESSQRWRDGKPLSPIDGMPIGVKDVIETKDMPTGMGSPLFAGVRSGRDSASVAALRQAGAILVGKTVTTEFAASVAGPTRNPHDLTRTPGGSSSGSAAGAAAGFFSVGLGTQVVGSILRPASFCGVVGFKPSFGAINRGGSHDFMSQSAQGALGASRADVWSVLIEIATRVGGDPGWPPLAGPAEAPAARPLRALVVLETPGWTHVSRALRGAFEAALARIAGGGTELITRRESELVETVEQSITQCLSLTRTINGYESLWPMNIYRERDASKLSAAILERLAEAEQMTPADYRAALGRRREMRAHYARLASLADACVTLSANGAAPVGLEWTGDAAFVVPGSSLGVPAITLPLLAEAGLPVGVQLLGFDQHDADLFAVAATIEAALAQTAES